MKTAIYQFFTYKFRMKKFEPRIQKIVLGIENVQTIVDAINLSKERVKKK